MNVCFCPSCRSLILADFRYCPYCGAAAAKGPDLAEALAGPFDKLGVGGTVGKAAGKAAGKAERAAEGTMTASKESASIGDTSGARTNVFARLEESLDRHEADMDLILEELEKEGS